MPRLLQRRSSDLHDLLETTEMSSLPSSKYTDQPPSTTAPNDNAVHSTSMTPSTTSTVSSSQPPTPYRTYKRRWIGLLQLTLLNIIVSWDWLTYAPVSTTASRYFSVRVSSIDWLSTAFLFAFVAAAPSTVYTLNRGGPKTAIVTASALILFGNWIRYAGARAVGASGERGFGLTVLGQVLIGLAQPFVLAAPTRYSDMWFAEKGRIAATALASLANPFGGALGQLIDPFWANKPTDTPNMVLYVAIISTLATFPSFFIPHHPTTPPTPTSTTTHAPQPLTLRTFTNLTHNTPFLLLFISFTLLVTNFNALSSLLTPILSPYHFTETQSGLTGALLILIGLVTSALTSPLLDRFPTYRLPVLKFLVFADAPLYTAFVFAPATRSVPAVYVVAALLGAASFSLVPLALEMVVEVTKPLSPEVGSVIVWCGGQLGGAGAILIMDALRVQEAGGGDEPGGNMKAGLVFLAVLAWVAVPGPLGLGWWKGTWGMREMLGGGGGGRAGM